MAQYSNNIWSLKDAFYRVKECDADFDKDNNADTITWPCALDSYNPMEDWDTDGTYATNSSTVLAQSAGYPVYAEALSKQSFNFFDGRNYTIDWEWNKSGINSSPFPGQYFGITRVTDVASLGTGMTGAVFWNFCGNGYAANWRIRNSADSANLHTYSNDPNAYAYAGYPHRITYDGSLGKFNFYASTTTYANKALVSTYTMSGPELSAWQSAGYTDFHVAASGRGGTDGVRNVRVRVGLED